MVSIVSSQAATFRCVPCSRLRPPTLEQKLVFVKPLERVARTNQRGYALRKNINLAPLVTMVNGPCALCFPLFTPQTHCLGAYCVVSMVNHNVSVNAVDSVVTST